MDRVEGERAGRWVEPLLLGGLLLVAFAVRFPFRDVAPINDEGEYLHLGQRILQGDVPYADVYNQKTPFTFYFMALVQWLAGESVAAMRIATSLYGAASTCVVYAAARGLGDRTSAFWAAVAFSVMTFDQCGVLHQASTEFFMLLWVALALWIGVGWRHLPDGTRLLLAGAAAGMAYQTKQTGLVVLVFLLASCVWRWILSSEESPDGWKRAAAQCGWVTVGWGLVFAGVAGYFASVGALDAYVECTWTNNWQYVGGRWEGEGRVMSLAKRVVLDVARWDVGLWGIGSAGVFVEAFDRNRRATDRVSWILLVGFAIAAFGTGKAYVHYWEPLIVPLALGCGVVCAGATRRVVSSDTAAWVRTAALVVLVGPFVWPAVHVVSSLREDTETILARSIGMPQFEVSQAVASYVRQRTEPGECFTIVGSEPQIFFFADRPSCTRMVFTFPITGAYEYASALRDEFVADLRERAPSYVLFTRLGGSLAEEPTEELRIFLRVVRETLGGRYRREVDLPAADGANPNASSGYFTVLRRVEP